MLLGGNERGDLFVCLMLNSVSLEKPNKKLYSIMSPVNNKGIHLFSVKSEELNSVL